MVDSDISKGIERDFMVLVFVRLLFKQDFSSYVFANLFSGLFSVSSTHTN